MGDGRWDVSVGQRRDTLPTFVIPLMVGSGNALAPGSLVSQKCGCAVEGVTESDGNTAQPFIVSDIPGGKHRINIQYPLATRFHPCSKYQITNRQQYMYVCTTMQVQARASQPHTVTGDETRLLLYVVQSSGRSLGKRTGRDGALKHGREAARCRAT